LGFNIIIHAATLEELKPIQNNILTQTPGIRVICAAQDSSVAVNWDQFMEPLKDLNITVLINNVGVAGVNGCGFNALEKASCEAIEQNIRINAIFPTQLTRNLLPILSTNSPSLILNLTSASLWTKPPFLSVYTGTKGYNLAWSQCLRHELRMLQKEVECKAVMTGAVRTTGYSIPENFWTPNADDYAESMLARAGSSAPVFYGSWKHQIQVLPSIA
jgi:17beta-estradiol 17-dehydrogenase / very-long-chain 3-oxoacyl-CoA reductase